jgi:hypothetical protein
MSIFCWSDFSLPKLHWQPHIFNKTFHKYPHRDHHTSLPNWKSSLELPGMIYNRHRPQNEEAVWTIPAKRKYPLGEGFKQVVALTAFKGCTRVRDALPASPFLCPAIQLNQCVGCRRSMVMKPKLWIYCVPTRQLDTKRHHACAQRGTLSETFRYASPRMATAQRQYVYVSVST